MRYGLVTLVLLLATPAAAQQTAHPRQQPGASITMFAPEQHDLYDGHLESEEQAESRSLHALLWHGGHVEVAARRLDGRGAPTYLMIAMVAAGALSVHVEAEAQSPVTSAKTPTVLFMCPHGAAKSVLASAYFTQMAKERGLNVRVESAGTDPDPTVSPAVAAHLKRQGYPVPSATPRKVTSADFEAADVVISIGCDLSVLQQPRGKLVRWDEVPPLSEDFARADEAIRKRVSELIDELTQRKNEWP